MPKAWNAWYHCMCNTYGTWLRGDPRGFRTRHHREHVEGDYHNPPPEGMYTALHERSKRLMKFDPVLLPVETRQPILGFIVESLHEQGIEVVVASLDDHHLHLLARFPDHNPRVVLGIAKHFATKQFRTHSAVGFPLELGQGLWTKRSKAEPVRSRSHQLNVVRYVLKHKGRGAAIWRMPPSHLENH